MPIDCAIESQGTLVALANRSGQPPQVKQKRGKITRFSGASRTRLMRRLSRIRETRAVFMTLTYPERYPDAPEAKQHLRALLERFRRAYPRACAVWRIEAQERGAPHFHLIWWNLPYFPFETLRHWWHEIIEKYHPVEDDPLFVRLEMCWNVRHVMNYVSKYVAKETEHGFRSYDGSCFFNDGAYLHAGRFWGFHNAPCIPWDVRLYIAFHGVSEANFVRAKRWLASEWEGLNDDPQRGGVVWSAISQILFDMMREELDNENR